MEEITVVGGGDGGVNIAAGRVGGGRTDVADVVTACGTIFGAVADLLFNLLFDDRSFCLDTIISCNRLSNGLRLFLL